MKNWKLIFFGLLIFFTLAPALDADAFTRHGIGATTLNTERDAINLKADITTVNEKAAKGANADITSMSALTGVTHALVIDGSADTEQLTIKGHSTQNDRILLVTDDSDVVLMSVSKRGKIHSGAGVKGVANDWGDALSGWDYGQFVAEHTISGDGNYDATGNAAGEAIFSDATNSPFTQADADNHNWVVVNDGTFLGAKAEIVKYIDADNVQLHAHTGTWDEDLASVSFKIYPAPQFILSAGGSTFFYTGQTGVVHISPSGGSFLSLEPLINISAIAGVDNADILNISADADGFNNVDSLQLTYRTGDLQTGDSNQVIEISMDESEATAGTMTAISIQTTAASSATRKGICMSAGLDSALTVSGAVAADPDFGWEVLADHTVTDRVNSAGAGDDAFVNAAVDQELFDANGDYILVGDAAEFATLEVILAVVASKSITPTFEYSTGVGTWSILAVGDTTQGFQQSGLITWTPPGDWAVTTKADGTTGDITSGYYIRIARTYATVIPTLPTEDYFKIYGTDGAAAGMSIRGDGVIKLPYLTTAPGSLENGLIWMESDGIHIYRGSTEYTIPGT